MRESKREKELRLNKIHRPRHKSPMKHFSSSLPPFRLLSFSSPLALSISHSLPCDLLDVHWVHSERAEKGPDKWTFVRIKWPLNSSQKGSECRGTLAIKGTRRKKMLALPLFLILMAIEIQLQKAGSAEMVM